MPDGLDQSAIDNLLAMAGGDADFVDEVVDAFLAEAPREMEALRAAIAAGDPASAVRPAHTIKGMSVNLGATRVVELARGLEDRARGGSLDGADDAVAALAGCLDDLAVELAAARGRRWLPAGPGPGPVG
jgi:HPt (histidine-containing phosphotransfer) domain-containing protein